MSADRCEEVAKAFNAACVLCATDFEGGVALLQSIVPVICLDEVKDALSRQMYVGDEGAVSCSLYLTARAHSIDLAIDLGYWIIDLGFDHDEILITLSSLLSSRDQCATRAIQLLESVRCLIDRGDALLSKLADYYRNDGRAFKVEQLINDAIRRGRTSLNVRLAEHWVEFHDWGAAFALLNDPSFGRVTSETVYFLGRSAAALLLESKVKTTIVDLGVLPEPGPTYAKLLAAVWEWRVGSPSAAIEMCPHCVITVPLIARDLMALRGMERAGPVTTVTRASEAWRSNLNSAQLPNVLAIGVQRSASSWLWSVLRQFVEVQDLPFKEPTFFNELFRGLSLYPASAKIDDRVGYWLGPTRNIRTYQSLFSEGKPIRVDVSPSYAELPEVAVEAIQGILGKDMRIILSVRDPVERSWSNLKLDNELIGHNALDLSFEDRSACYNSSAMLRRCDYPNIIKTWRKYFNSVYIIVMDDVQKAPRNVIDGVCRYLEIDPVITSRMLKPVYATQDVIMPVEDRAFLFGLHQHLYDDCEGVIGSQVRQWRKNQIRKLQSS